MKIITIGDNVVDCYLDQGKYYPGGNCVNVAVNCKRSGAEEVGYIGVFATDDKADHLKNVLGEEKVDFHRSRTVEGISGQPKVNLSEDGDRIFVGGPTNTVRHQVKIRLIQDDIDYLKNFHVAHSSCYSFLEEELPVLSEHIKVSFDFSDRREPEYLGRVCPHISYGFFSGADLNEEELERLVSELEKYDLEVIGITRGARPALFIHKGVRYHQEALETEVVDTMGAGDSFIAGFLTAFVETKNIVHALEVAAHNASVTCGFYGGFGYPKALV
ncbi:fructoselysine 6-kinase [Evansella vedderi]|uniref:Fructoselysine 6-kinase n=1 Tax=Evansella vedderi TaxID=38282 RepID=A0ABT9ZQA2_9BACI|nr:PfkB family carbohydrate kinase [Evansella vedderi]MDQ0253029.1 fructoselysine 6-kinase [Evansella vedderi]